VTALKFKPGARVRCVNAFRACPELVKGDVYVVSRVAECWVMLEDCPFNYFAHRFELVPERRRPNARDRKNAGAKKSTKRYSVK